MKFNPIQESISLVSDKEMRENKYGRSSRIDSVHRIPYRDNFFAQLELTQIKNTLYLTKEEEFIGAQIFSQSSEWQAGAREVGYDMMEPVSNAQIGAQGAQADDIPFVAEKMEEATQKAVELQIGIRYTQQELEAADARNTVGRGAIIKLVTERANMARRAISRIFDKGIFQGFDAYGLKGLQTLIPGARQSPLTTSNNIAAYEAVPATGTSSSTLWSAKSGQNIIKDLTRAKINGVEKAKIFKGANLIVDSAAYKFLIDPYSDLSGKSILSYINEAGMFKNVWVTNAVAKANNGRANTYFVVCDSEEEIAEIPILRPITVFPSETDFAQMTKQLVAMRFAGLMVKYPAGFYFADGHIEAPA